MSIKRGVSLYSYQQTQFLGKMDVWDQIREVRESLHTDGIEIINMTSIRDYPNPSDAWVDKWHDTMAKYNMKAVTMDVYMDVLRYRDHVMLYDECAETLKADIRLAKKLGFANIRCLSAVPLEVMKMALPLAEELDIRLGKEIHASHVLDDELVTEMVDYVDRRQTKHLGLVPDMGIFGCRPCPVITKYEIRNGMMTPEMAELAEEAYAKKLSSDEVFELAQQRMPGVQRRELHFLRGLEMYYNQKPELMKDLVPYIVSIHGKFLQMTEIPSQPGHYEDVGLDYETPFKYLKEGGYEGYVNSEYEGQRYQQDLGEEYFADEVEEVRRHHEMLRRLIGE